MADTPEVTPQAAPIVIGELATSPPPVPRSCRNGRKRYRTVSCTSSRPRRAEGVGGAVGDRRLLR